MNDDFAQRITELEERLGPGVVSRDPGELASFLVDERKLYSGSAGALVRPHSVEQLQQVMAHCHLYHIGVVPQGGNTGYCGAATPLSAQHVLLKLDRLKRLRELNPANFSMTIEAGVILADAQAAARSVDLEFPLSMGSEGSAQIGGAIATNAGGLNVVRYGMTRDLVLGLEAVLADGTLISRARGLRKDNSGFRFADLLIGSEGCLAVITAATFKLFPPLPGRATALLATPSVETACDLLGHFRNNCDDNLLTFELVTMSAATYSCEQQEARQLTETWPDASLLLVEVASGSKVRAEEMLEGAVALAMEDGRVLDGILAQSIDQRQRLWRFRESIPEGEKQAGGSIKHDVSLPVADIPAYLDRVTAELESVSALRLSAYGHIGDGNLHCNVLAPEGVDSDAWKGRFGDAVKAIIHGVAEELGGSFSAEHGIGVLKKAELANWRSAEELALMRELKRVFDPHGIMNPGKVI